MTGVVRKWLAALGGAALVVGLAGSAMAGGRIVTPEGDLPFDGLYVNFDDGLRSALSVTAFRASIVINFETVRLLEFVGPTETGERMIVRVTFADSYVLEAEFDVAAHAPFVATGAYGRAIYEGAQLSNGDIIRIEFDEPAPGENTPTIQADGG